MSSRSESAMRQARLIGRVRFAGQPDVADLVLDCSSTAWELERSAAPHVEAGQIAQIAVKRVAIGRHFRPSIRSIGMGWQPKKAKRPKFRQVEICLETLAAPDVDPAELACFLIDYKEWLSRMTRKRRKLVEQLAAGARTGELARSRGCSPGRISQIRRELEKSWRDFVGEN